ncbi:MAG: NlpC/P60 family protein [Caldimonas sp.]
MTTGQPAQRSARALTVGLFLVASLGVPLAGAAPSDPHVASAERLVEQLDLANTDYAHGQGSVTWTGSVTSHTDCSGFIDHLLMHDDGYTTDDFKRWFGSRRPSAMRYHDAIVEGRGFTRLAAIAELRAGDLIAIKYLTRHDNTGHVMLVVEAPRRMLASPPHVDGATQWSVAVIDSSESGHGPTDTRHKRGADGRDHDGLGRGVFRLYANAAGEVAGFSWSTAKVSHFVSPDDEHLVLGRLAPGFRP